MYLTHTLDKRTTKYRDFIREKAFDMGLLNINEHKPVSLPKILQEPRSTNDLYQIIMNLQTTPLNYDCIQEVIKTVATIEPLSTREWHMNMYEILRESQLCRVCMDWYWNKIIGFFLSPLSNARIQLMIEVKGKTYRHQIKDPDDTWISSPQVVTPTLQIYKRCNHFDRISNHRAPTISPKVNWNETNGEWIRKISKPPVYVPYSIKWTGKQKFSKEFIEGRRKDLSFKRPFIHQKHSPWKKPFIQQKNSPWIRIECGNQYTYQNKLTNKTTKELPKEGISDINITDIYLFDQIS